MSDKPTASAPGFSLAPDPLVRKPELTGGSTELLALRATIGMLNDPALTGAAIPAAERAANIAVIQGAGQAIPTGGEKFLPAQPPPPEPEAAKPVRTIEQLQARRQLAGPHMPAIPPPKEKPPEKVFFTGRLGVGKDFTAAAAGYPVIGFADPLYQLAETFFRTPVNATSGKDAPGMRDFLQCIGQYGRNEVSPQYPYTPTRAIFLVMIRSLAASGTLPPGTDWEKFGNPDFWIDSLLKRAEGKPRLAITNCRFANEFTRLKAASWQHFHILASPAAWTERLAKKNLTPQSPAVNDVSELMAKQLDAQVVQTLSREKSGPKLRVIWSDPSPSPSPRLYTLDEFVSVAKNSDGGSLIV